MALVTTCEANYDYLTLRRNAPAPNKPSPNNAIVPGSGTDVDAQVPASVSVNPLLQLYVACNNDHVESELIAALKVTENGFNVPVPFPEARLTLVPVFALVRKFPPTVTVSSTKIWFISMDQVELAKAANTIALKFQVMDVV